MFQVRSQNSEGEVKGPQSSSPEAGHSLAFNERHSNQFVLITSAGTQHVINTPVAATLYSLWGEAQAGTPRYLCRDLIERIAGIKNPSQESSDIYLEAISKIPCRRGSASYESARMQGENARRCIGCDTASMFSLEDDAIS